MKIITAQELKSKLDSNEDLQLIDVREDYEFDDFNIGGINIPMAAVISSIDKIEKNKPVIFVCRSGKRSKAVILALGSKFNLVNIYSLAGGVVGYQETIG
jgi:rhodanese-related sulfurtransferase